MNPKRLWTVCRLELITTFKRPLFWIWIFLVLLLAMIVSAGVMKIHSGEDMAGGLQANITSQFANAWEMALLGAMLYPLFVAALAGMGVLRDGELRLEGLLHSTPLRPAEYVWGSFLAAMIISLFTISLSIPARALKMAGLTSRGCYGRWTLIGTPFPLSLKVSPPILSLWETTIIEKG